MPPILYLIDGHALAYRTYFALTAGTGGGAWQTSKGEPTAGVYGFASVLLRILEQEKPEYLAVAFDTGKTFRDTIYTEYKATRAKMPDDLRTQIERIRELVDAFNIPRLEKEGYEADDVLGTIARQAADKGLGVKIITGDRDLLQLVDERIIVSLPGNKLSDSKDYTIKNAAEVFGVPPHQVVDYKALVGDKSDNIPGVAGVGEKTALELLKTYPTLDTIYAHLQEIPNRVRTKLEADREKAYLSQKLAQIDNNVPISLDLEQAKANYFDPDRVEKLFRELEFRTLVGRLAQFRKAVTEAPPPPSQQLSLFGEEVRVVGAPAPTEIKVHTIQKAEDLQSLVGTLQNARLIAFDTETTGTDPMQAKLVGISLAVREGEGYYIPVGHVPGAGEQLPLEQVIDALRAPFSNPAIGKAGHNLKYDLTMLRRAGIDVAPLTFDTMIAEWLVNPASRNLGLKNLAWVRLGQPMTHIEDLIGKGKTQVSMDVVAIDSAAAYAAADAEVCLRLIPQLEKELQQQNAKKLFDELEMPLVSTLADMEMAGIPLDVPFIKGMSAELQARMEEIEKKTFAAVGATFNLNSTQQLSTILFERLRLEPPGARKKTASGHFSTSADVLEELRGHHPVVDWILEYRELAKLKSTYTDALPLQVNPHTGRVHTSYNQTGSVTGRIASTDPNLQNIPTRTDLGRRVREAFIAAPGLALLSVDYSQIELRIVAHMAQDEAMLDAFRHGQDIHATTAAAIFGVPLEQVTKEQRRHSKAINFGLIYGMSAFGLTRTTDLTLAEAEDFVQAYFRQFPGVKNYLDGIRRRAAREGYVETLLGRRRYFPGLQSQTNANIRNREEREAINAPIQGTAADIMKLAMLKVPAALRQAGLPARMLLQVHDELVLECPLEQVRQTAQVVQLAMESAFELQIPLATEARWGANWGTMQVLTD